MESELKTLASQGITGPGPLPPTSTSSTTASIPRLPEEDVDAKESVQQGKSRTSLETNTKAHIVPIGSREKADGQLDEPEQIPPGLDFGLPSGRPGLPPGLASISASASSVARLAQGGSGGSSSEEPGTIDFHESFLKGPPPAPPLDLSSWRSSCSSMPPPGPMPKPYTAEEPMMWQSPFGGQAPTYARANDECDDEEDVPQEQLMQPFLPTLGGGGCCMPEMFCNPQLLQEQKALLKSQLAENQQLKSHIDSDISKREMRKQLEQWQAFAASQQYQLTALNLQLMQSMVAHSQSAMMIERDHEEKPWWFKKELYAHYLTQMPQALVGDYPLTIEWQECPGIYDANKEQTANSRLIRLGNTRPGPKNIQICPVINIIPKGDRSSARVVDLCMRCGKTRCEHWKAGKCNVRPCIKFCHNGHGNGSCHDRRQRPQFHSQVNTFAIPNMWWFCGFKDLSREDQLTEMAHWGWL